MIQVIPYHLGAFFARFTPDWFCRGITWTLAEANWWLRPGTRGALDENLRIVRPEWTAAERRKAARRTVHHFARGILLFLQLPFLDPDELFARCDVSLLRSEIDRLGGRPFIIASAHVGPWELGGYCLARMGHEIHTVALDHPTRQITEFYSARREYLGIHAHPLGESFSKLKEVVDRGGSVALLVDRAYGKVKKRFTFFGVRTEFPLGHLVLAARCNAPVLTGALVFDGPGRFKYVHGGTHFAEDAADEFEKLERLQERCLRDLEGIIRAYPDQWFHFIPLEHTESSG